MLACTGSLIGSPSAAYSLPRIDKLFSPVSSSVRNAALSVIKEPPKDPKTKKQQHEMELENQQLRQESISLKREIARLNGLNNVLDTSRIPGPIMVNVIGGDYGNQQVLSLQLPGGMKLYPGAPVYSDKGFFAGKLEIVGIGAARVRLVTDKASRVQASFTRFDKNGANALPHARRIVQGTGDGKMMIEGVKRADLAAPGNPDLKLMPGDWVVVEDNDLPSAAQYKKIGEIESIVDGNKPLFVNVIIRADEPLMRLTQVIVSKN